MRLSFYCSNERDIFDSSICRSGKKSYILKACHSFDIKKAYSRLWRIFCFAIITLEIKEKKNITWASIEWNTSTTRWSTTLSLKLKIEAINSDPKGAIKNL